MPLPQEKLSGSIIRPHKGSREGISQTVLHVSLVLVKAVSPELELWMLLGHEVGAGHQTSTRAARGFLSLPEHDIDGAQFWKGLPQKDRKMESHQETKMPVQVNMRGRIWSVCPDFLPGACSSSQLEKSSRNRLSPL